MAKNKKARRIEAVESGERVKSGWMVQVFRWGSLGSGLLG
jgi:hypothetical protein